VGTYATNYQQLNLFIPFTRYQFVASSKASGGSSGGYLHAKLLPSL